MTPHYEDESVRLFHGDCLDVLKTLPDNSVDSVCTDPPYGLADHAPGHVTKAFISWLGGDREHVPDGRGFMGKEWDRFVPPPAVFDECRRVLKPGGHLLCFSGTRTLDLMTTSIRFAGFEIRDSIAWLYGSGFPKSLDVSKAIDKAAGAERQVIGEGAAFGRGSLRNRSRVEAGYRPTELNPDGGAAALTAPATEAAQQWQGWGTALKPAFEPIVVGRKPLAGTVAGNVLEHGTGALNIDACRVGSSGGTREVPDGTTGKIRPTVNFGMQTGDTVEAGGRWPTNVVLDESQAAELDKQTGTLTSGSRSAGTYGLMGYMGADAAPMPAVNGDSGGASRFFPTFRYEAKAPTSERPTYQRDGEAQLFAGSIRKRCVICGKQEVNVGDSACACEEPDFQPDPAMLGKVAHPTVKPLDLMRWLVRLVTPPGGTVLEPFAGSGTTAEACVIEGLKCIAIEREADYLPLIIGRLSKPIQMGLDFDATPGEAM